MTKFLCKKCGSVLTLSLKKLSNLSSISKEAKADFLPQGNYYVGTPEYYPKMANDYFLNRKDVINTKKHSDINRLNGCCGLDGLDGYNTICQNGHEVGTEKSDCWMAHAMIFDKNLVEQIDE